jgi:hypothetical protein
MSINKKCSSRDYLFFTLLIFFLISFCACAKGSGNHYEDTTDNSSSGTTCDLSYSQSILPTGTSFTDLNYDPDDATDIAMDGGSVAIDGPGATADSSKGTISITSSGTYNVHGTLSDGQILVTTEDSGLVRLVLNGANISCSDGPPIFFKNARETNIIVLKDNTVNSVTDGQEYSSLDADGEPDAAIFSKSFLVIYGGGELTVNANYMDGIKSKDALIIDSGTITVNSSDDGIVGRDYLSVENGNITINPGGDGLKSTNDECDKGYVYVQNGAININNAGGGGIEAQRHVVIEDGKINITANGKGIRGNTGVTIFGGTFDINSTTDDAIHSNDTIVIDDGDFYIVAGDDAMHANKALTIDNGVIDIATCYEGLESKVITINDGNVHVQATNDPINASDGSGAMNYVAGCHLYINGGYISVKNIDTTDSDGFDSNGDVVMTGGIVVINGGIGANGIMDYGKFKMSGGFIIGAGTSSMPLPAGDATSTQNNVFVYLNGTADTILFHVQRSDGVNVVTFMPGFDFGAIEFSSPLLVENDPEGNPYTYTVYTGGSYSGGSVYDGLYGTISDDDQYVDSGTYSGGTQKYTFTISAVTTYI